MMDRLDKPGPPGMLVLFDIDGTLLLSGGAGKRALNETFEELFGVAGAFDGIPVAGRTDPLLLHDALAQTGLTAAADLRARFHDRYCERLAVTILDPLPRKGLMPGVRSLLARLEGRPDLTSALLTGNFARAARIKLEYFGLWRHFACGAYGDDAASRDELVPVAITRARRQGIAIESSAQVVVVGDTPLDIRCARAAGAWSVAVATGPYSEAELTEHGADRVLPDLADTGACMELFETMGTAACGRS